MHYIYYIYSIYIGLHPGGRRCWRRRRRRRRRRKNFPPAPAPTPARTGIPYPVWATPHSDNNPGRGLIGVRGPISNIYIYIYILRASPPAAGPPAVGCWLLAASDSRILGFSDSQILGLSDYRILGFSDSWILGLSDYWFLGLSDFQILGF